MSYRSDQITGTSKTGNVYWFYMCSLFIFGLNIPTVSTMLVSIILPYAVYKIITKRRIVKSFLLDVFLLTLFLMSYYFASYKYGYTELLVSIIFIVIVLSLYVMGYSITKANTHNWPFGIVNILLSLLLGASIFATLSINNLISVSSFYGNVERSAVSFWGVGELINGKGIGAISSVGMGLIFSLLLGATPNATAKLNTPVRLIIFSLCLQGVVVNLVLQNRSPFIGFFMALIAAIVISAMSKRNLLAKHILVGTVVAGFFSVVMLVLDVPDKLMKINLVKRFLNEGLDTGGRIHAWGIMLQNLLAYPWGGREVYLEGVTYVHNLWLDVAYDAGIMPLLFLLAFHMRHLKSFIFILKASLPLFMKLTFAVLLVIIFANFMQEPTMAASPVYFGISCFIMGVIRRLSIDISRQKSFTALCHNPTKSEQNQIHLHKRSTLS